jgi:hypothetical protein
LTKIKNDNLCQIACAVRSLRRLTAKPPANNMKTDGFALAAPNDAEHLWGVQHRRNCRTGNATEECTRSDPAIIAPARHRALIPVKNPAIAIGLCAVRQVPCASAVNYQFH